MLLLWIILRPLLTIILWALFFAGFLWWSLQANVADKLLTAEFYTDTISQQDAYNRIYDEVLLDEDLEDTTQDLLGGVQVISQQEVADLSAGHTASGLSPVPDRGFHPAHRRLFQRRRGRA